MLNNPQISKINYLKKIIIVSLSEIFKDIIPGYKIKIRQNKENNNNNDNKDNKEVLLSKDVKLLREYEETLVKQYKLYIDYLIDSLNKTLNKIKENKLDELEEEQEENDKDYKNNNELEYCLIILGCLCKLLDNLNHFNYRQELIEIICKQLTNKHTKLSKLSYECIDRLFKKDKQLDLSLDIISQMYKLLKQYSYGVKKQFIDLLLSLNLNEIKLNEQSHENNKNNKLTHKEKMTKFSRNDRKKLKEKEKLEIDLDEQKLNDKLKQLSNKQTKILELLFLIYFNILKKMPNLKLIPSVLHGLSEYSHLISLDYFDDLINIIHELILNNRLNYKSKLYSIKTIFIILNGNCKSLLIDPLRFYNCLYNLILDTSLINNNNNNHNNEEENDDILLLIDCINLMFLKRSKQIPINRLLAFIKRLSLLTLQLQNTIQCVLILNLIKKLINLNRISSDLLFDNEFKNNIYNPYSLESDFANAQNTCLWELYLLQVIFF
jgi:nucleolar complex protein 3